MRSRIVLGTLAVVVLGGAGTAAAEAKRVGVPRFDGPQEATVRRAVMQVLKGSGYEVVGAKELDAAAKGTGVQLDSNDGFKTVAKELAVSAFVAGEVSKKKAKLTVRNGSDGSVSGEGSFGGPNPNKIAADVRDGFTRRLGSAVERGRAPSGAKKPTAAPPPEAEEPEEKEAKEAPPVASNSGGGSDDSSSKSKPAASGSDETPPSTRSDSGGPDETLARKAPPPPEAEGGPTGPRALDIGIGLGGFSRSFDYNQDYSGLRSYKLQLGPVAVASVIVFPAAFMTSSFAANVGLEGRLEQTFGVTSSVAPTTDSTGAPIAPYPNGANFSTIIHDYYGGARVRLPLRGGHEIAVFGGGGEHAFSFRTNGDRQNLTIPDTIYNYLRGGVDARFELPSGMTAGASLGYRYIINRGGSQITSDAYFPGLGVAGIDAGAMLGYHVTPSIEARFDVNLRRYFYAMNSIQGDTRVAGGAVDQYIGFTFGAAYIFGGVAPGASSAADEEPAAAAPTKKKKKKKADEGNVGGDSDADDSGGGGDSDQP
jgi:hypothetical protein